MADKERAGVSGMAEKKQISTQDSTVNDFQSSDKVPQADRSAPTRTPEEQKLLETLEASMNGSNAPQQQLDLYEQWGRLNPQAALQHAQQRDSDFVFFCIRAVLHGWLDRDPAAVAAWIAQQPEGTDKSQFVTVLMERAAPESLPALAEWARSQLDSPGSAAFVQGLLHQWGEIAPKSAADWVLKNLLYQPSSPGSAPTSVRPEFKSFFANWATQDAAAVATYISTLPTGSPARDHASAAFASHAIVEDPETALLWADSITDPTLRSTTRTLLEATRFQLMLQGNLTSLTEDGS